MDLRGKALKRESSWRGKKKGKGGGKGKAKAEEQNSVRGCGELIALAFVGGTSCVSLWWMVFCE